jgi:hypothetical protein
VRHGITDDLPEAGTRPSRYFFLQTSAKDLFLNVRRISARFLSPNDASISCLKEMQLVVHGANPLARSLADNARVL